MADEEAIPSISSGVVGSRFVTQSDVEAARARRDEQWKAAYARSQPFFIQLSFFLGNLRLSQARPRTATPTTRRRVRWSQSGRGLPLSPPSCFPPPCSSWPLETRRQSRKSRPMAQRRARARTRPHVTSPLIPVSTLGSQTGGMGREN